MFEIVLKNGKTFLCERENTIFEAAQKANITLEHSCLIGRCRSCLVKILEGKTVNRQKELVLTQQEKDDNFILSCNSIPLSNLKLDIEDLENIEFFNKRIIPAKIDSIEKYNEEIINLKLRLPPTIDFNFNPGQYVNIKKGNLKRSYSIASSLDKKKLEFIIKKYDKGLMSKYWFEDAKINDVLTIEGPLGSFFVRDSNFENIVFLATGTGIAPIKAILEKININYEKYLDKKFWLLVGVRTNQDLIWEPNSEFNKINIKYIPVFSRDNKTINKKSDYVQDVLLKLNINLKNSQVYACGSELMIKSSKELLINNSLPSENFFSDAFIETN